MAILANIAGAGAQVSARDRLLMFAERQKAGIGATTQQTGVALMTVAPALATIPVVGWIAAAGAELIGTFLKLFGSNYNTSTNVRWLTQNYENYVLGQNQRSDNTVNEADVPNAQKWFSYVLGVPIFDRLDWYAIKGWSPSSETNLNNTDAQRVAAYKTSPRASGVPDASIMQAVQIAKTLNFTDAHGSWANRTAAPTLVNATTALNSTGPATAATPVPGPVEAGAGSGAGLLLLLGVSIGILALVNKGKRKKR